MEQHQKNVEILLEKIEESNAILVGAAAGMSASCGFNFFIPMMSILKSILEIFIVGMDMKVHSMVIIIGIHQRRHAGRLLPELVI